MNGRRAPCLENLTMESRSEMGKKPRNRVAIACQGGGSHTAFTAGVLQGLLGQPAGGSRSGCPERHFRRGHLCGTGLGRARAGRPAAGDPESTAFWETIAASEPWEQVLNQTVMSLDEPAGPDGPAGGESIPPADVGRGSVPRDTESAL